MEEQTHRYIIKLLWVSKDSENVYMIYEYANRGELWSLLQKLPYKRVPVLLALAWLGQLQYALFYLHKEKQLCHRDIKSENIMLYNDYSIRLIDFGTSKKWNDIVFAPKVYENNIQVCVCCYFFHLFIFYYYYYYCC